jgi:hypothetical protein
MREINREVGNAALDLAHRRPVKRCSIGQFALREAGVDA